MPHWNFFNFNTNKNKNNFNFEILKVENKIRNPKFSLIFFHFHGYQTQNHLLDFSILNP